MSEIILGLSGVGGHDSAAALVVDGSVVAAAEQERFDRVKHSGMLPVDAVRACLDHAGVIESDVTAVALGFDPHLRWKHALHFVLATAAERAEQARLTGGPDAVAASFATAYNIERSISDSVNKMKAWVQNTFGRELQFVSHHHAHAAVAWHWSGWGHATAVVVDLIGEWRTTSVLDASKANGLKELWTVSYPHSLGQLYATFTSFLGFTQNRDEYKIMGLAAYGNPAVYRKTFRRMVQLREDGSFSLAPSLLPFVSAIYPGWSRELETILGPSRMYGAPIKERHKNIAAALQDTLEYVLRHIVQHAVECTGNGRVVLSGGVALNCVANDVVASLPSVERLFVPPTPHDGGVALGAALYSCKRTLHERPIRTPFLGPSFPLEEMLEEARVLGLSNRVVTEEELSCLLADGSVLGRFHGRMEYGPRALGHRSIFASPTDASMRDHLNMRVKFREAFRPFAPVIRREDLSTWFKSDEDLPYMTRAVEVRSLATEEAPAVVHVNDRARVQTIDSQSDPFLASLLSAFGSKTGVPILVNTSLNTRGEPIACRPSEAIKLVVSGSLDGIILGDQWLATK